MARCLRRGRYFAAVIVALCAMVAATEYGAVAHDLVGLEGATLASGEAATVETIGEAREARMSWLRAIWLATLIVLIGLVSLVRFSRPSPSPLPRAHLRGASAAGLHH